LNKGFKEQVSEVFLRSKHIDMYYLSDIN
jgi:hypothetical protein